MVRMQIYLPEALYADLKKWGRMQSVPMSEIIRDGLKKVLYQDSGKTILAFDPLKDFVGRVKSRQKTDAVSEIQAHYKKNPR